MYKIYIIREGDTLDSIAQKFNTSLQVLNRINGMILNLVPGSMLIIPNNKEMPYIPYIVNKGDNIYEIAKRYKVNYMDILLINGLEENDYIYPNQELLIPKEGTGIYYVKQDETLGQVAFKLKIPVEEIIRENASLYLQPDQIILYNKMKMHQ